MKNNYLTFEVVDAKRSKWELLKDSYALFRVAISRMMRGHKPRFKTLFR